MMRCSHDGVFAMLGTVRALRIPAQPATTSLAYETSLWLANSLGDTTVPFGEVSAGEVRPLGRITRLALGNDGLFIGTADSDFVDRYSLLGHHLAGISLHLPPRAPSRLNYESAIDARLRRLQGGSQAARTKLRDELLAIPMPAELPPYEDIFIDPSGLLWVDTSAPGDPATELRVITKEGRIVADILLRGRFTVFEVGQDYVLGGLDVDSQWRVVMYRLRRAPDSLTKPREASVSESALSPLQ